MEIRKLISRVQEAAAMSTYPVPDGRYPVPRLVGPASVAVLVGLLVGTRAVVAGDEGYPGYIKSELTDVTVGYVPDTVTHESNDTDGTEPDV